MEIEIERHYDANTTGMETSVLRARPGLWALVSTYHGRAAILEAGNAENVAMAVSRALDDLTDKQESAKDVHFVSAVAYPEDSPSGRLEFFLRDVRRKLDIRDPQETG